MNKHSYKLHFCQQVALTSELSAAVSQVSDVTMQLTALKRREAEMKTRLDMLESSERELTSQLSSVSVKNAGECCIVRVTKHSSYVVKALSQ